MFKLLVVVCCLAVSVNMIQTVLATYTTKFDNVVIDGILNNDRLLNNYFKCLMGTGKCTPEGDELKRLIPEALDNKCANCTKKQKQGSEKIIKFLYEKKNEMWKQLLEKYDPKGTYRQTYIEEAKKLNISLNKN